MSLHTLSTPTSEQLGIGRGVPSGKGGTWRRFEMSHLEGESMVLYYEDGRPHPASSKEDWEGLPNTGLQVIHVLGGVWHGADAYEAFGCVKYGTYLDDSEYSVIEEIARGGRD